MQLKLAEYKDGKFERFLELGKDFLFGGGFIVLHHDLSAFPWESQSLIETFEGRADFGDYTTSNYFEKFNKDEKDPLNRFDGLFNGRTYGEGRFVLMGKDEDDIFSIETFDDYGIRYEEFMIKKSYEELNYGGNMYENGKLIGNLHENPELWDKV